MAVTGTAKAVALMEANAWLRADPVLAATKVEEWTKIEKEVAYLYLGPGGIHTLDPTIKPRWIDTVKIGHGVLKKMNRIGLRKMGDPDMHAHMGINSIPIQIAVKFGVPLIIWGEHGFMNLGGMHSYRAAISDFIGFPLPGFSAWATAWMLAPEPTSTARRR
mgnify:CR=1 FL=1